MPDTQSLILFIAAMVAGVVCFRLFMILGRRTGLDPTTRPRDSAGAPARGQPEAAHPAPPAALEASRSDGPAASGLLDIQLADRSFDTSRFLAGARDAYVRIVKAFGAGDRASLVPLLSPQVLAAFEGAIAARGSATSAAFVSLDDAHIVAASLEGRHAEITVSFRATFADGPAGQDGNGAPQNVTDVWTFARNLDSADPNWLLVATTGELPTGEPPAGESPG
jgi:predicted lipid-binding transport protein (Tim44 family)